MHSTIRFDSFVRHSESDEVDKVLFNGAHCKSPQDLKRKSRAHLDRINTLMNVRGSTPYHQVQLKDGKIFKTYLGTCVTVFE